ncbi:glutamate-cysteine ligase [Candidatus Kinetoplastibacterium blastocrithidii TCC012E]|uniref:Glutamate--cysteine ligase n=1 Tax=Candidatus Kinetoplastidibacterium blastocrithidiae TCC012E TaxID=1208922 RepID=M1LZL8_9PROT|nr:glutamate--cysteine ligase [Candidatus Kinetoplastibacterium blastocrithidii]AFZ83415.1 glutamate--cysteine ligase [Candidatus Kinetoplastibacterium blastocrithidii (ex Strigomonas culicis)]AGF49511.1 glutamate-cysteine ligase [Candidatus Kinetoplastibacterium blastocrithidii TCC012E]
MKNSNIHNTPWLISNNLNQLEGIENLSSKILRGIEREALRVNYSGNISNLPHPYELGSSLTNTNITTDYSEALLEIITGTNNSVESLIKELSSIHNFVCNSLNNELLWHNSIPELSSKEDDDIPIAWFGKSNIGMYKYIYRKGLAKRYGKKMQCIAGLHYNFSLNNEILEQLQHKDKNQKNLYYFKLMRNFIRYSWLIVYLFGSTPAMPKDLMRKDINGLINMDDKTVYMPYATSLRVSKIGYYSKVQSTLNVSYNCLEEFLSNLYEAINKPWPEYQDIGTHEKGEWIQLNTNVLQIENEYYSMIRPKCSINNNDRLINNLKHNGVNYIEVRCLDIDLDSAIGINAETCRFLDSFLLFCATEDSPLFLKNEYEEHYENFFNVAYKGREPNLSIKKTGLNITLKQWATELIAKIGDIASILDRGTHENLHYDSVLNQLKKVNNQDLTPSAKIIRNLKDRKISLAEYSLEISKQHSFILKKETDSNHNYYKKNAIKSHDECYALEEKNEMSFNEYVNYLQDNVDKQFNNNSNIIEP